MGIRTDNAKALYIEGIRDGNYVEAINAYTGDRYTQHRTPVKDGRDGFIEFFADFVERNPDREIEIVRAFEDGRYVFLQAVQALNGGEFRYVTADIFDTDDEGKLIEHWDIIAQMGETTASGRTEIDGATELTNLADTELNKQLVRRFVDKVLVAGQLDLLPGLMVVDCAQHNARIADGVEAFKAFAKKSSMRYIEVHNVIGCGNFVAVLAEREESGSRQAVIDLYRVEDGKIVEHWDVIEDITPKDTWVNSGKF